MKTSIFSLLLTLVTSSALAMSKPPAVSIPAAECKKILKQNSSDWIKTYTTQHGDTTIDIVMAISQYSHCFEKKLDKLQKQLSIAGHGPLMGANANFRDLQDALEKFTNTVLKESAGGGSYDNLRASYARLYEKQFHYYFVQHYVNSAKPPVAHENEIEKAKKYLADLLSKPATNSAQGVKKSFDELASIAKHNGIPEIKVYEYAIMLLQSPAAKPFSPPPF